MSSPGTWNGGPGKRAFGRPVRASHGPMSLESLKFKTWSGQVKFSGGQLLLEVIGQLSVEGTEALGQGRGLSQALIVQEG